LAGCSTPFAPSTATQPPSAGTDTVAATQPVSRAVSSTSRELDDAAGLGSGVHPNHTVRPGGESRASGVPIHLLTQFVLKV